MGLYGGDSWWVEVSLSAITLVLLVGYWLKRKSEYFKSRGFAYVSMAASLPITIKSFTFQISFFDLLHYMYTKLDGHKIGGCFQIATPLLIVRDPDLVNSILIKDFPHFHDHGFDVDTEVNPLEGHLFNMEGKKWRALRNKLSPTFTSGKLKRMLPQISECADQLVELMLKSGAQEEDVLLRDLVSRFTLDVIGRCAFGLEAGSLKDPDNEFKRMATKIFRPTGFLLFKFMFRALFPKLSIRLKLKAQEDEVNDFFLGLTRQTFEHRLKTGLRRNDFMDLLLQLRQKGSVECDPRELAEDEEEEGGRYAKSEEDGPEILVLSDELLAAQIFIFLIGGWENTASGISLTLFLLGRNLQAQDTAREEVQRIKKKHGGITYEALKEMVYLECCVSEAMRLYPPGVALFHSCTKDYTLDGGQVIEKGTPVIIPTYSMQRDPEYFQDPDEFKPERFLPDHQVTDNVYLPFGAGPRMCIARRFVLLEVKMAVAKVLEKIKITNSPKVKEPLVIESRIFSFDFKGGMWARLEPLIE